jgi:hypothetical protein
MEKKKKIKLKEIKITNANIRDATKISQRELTSHSI